MKPTTPKEIVVEVRFPSKDHGSDLKNDDRHSRDILSKRASLDPTVQTLDSSSCTDLFSVSESETISTGVRFALEDTVYIPIQALDDMDEDERRAIWFTQENYNVIMGANNITVKLMRIGRDNPEAFGHCFRGLEYRLAENRKDREERTRNAFQAVLEEQQRQRETGVEVIDPKPIAKMYRLATLASLEIAMLRGESDAQAAASYQLEHASSTPPPRSQQQAPTSSAQVSSGSTVVSPVAKTDSTTAKPILEDDTVSVLSDESSTTTADMRSVSEGQGSLVHRLRYLVQKQRRSSGNSKSSSIKSHSRRQR